MFKPVCWITKAIAWSGAVPSVARTLRHHVQASLLNDQGHCVKRRCSISRAYNTSPDRYSSQSIGQPKPRRCSKVACILRHQADVSTAPRKWQCSAYETPLRWGKSSFLCPSASHQSPWEDVHLIVNRWSTKSPRTRHLCRWSTKSPRTQHLCRWCTKSPRTQHVCQ